MRTEKSFFLYLARESLVYHNAIFKQNHEVYCIEGLMKI
jgi:hypothetical protein